MLIKETKEDITHMKIIKIYSHFIILFSNGGCNEKQRSTKNI